MAEIYAFIDSVLPTGEIYWLAPSPRTPPYWIVLDYTLLAVIFL